MLDETYVLDETNIGISSGKNKKDCLFVIGSVGKTVELQHKNCGRFSHRHLDKSGSRLTCALR